MTRAYRPSRRWRRRRTSEGARLRLGDVDGAITDQLFGGPAPPPPRRPAAGCIDPTVEEGEETVLLLD
jgi:hypothetical protein